MRLTASVCAASNQSLIEAARRANAESLLDCLCDLGEAADRLQNHGQDQMAESLYNELLALLKARRVEELYLWSKVTLGLILLNLRRGRPQAAYDIWMSDKMPYGAGVQGLNAREVSSHDYVLFGLLCSWMYSMGPTKSVALERMNEHMDGICSHLARTKDPFLPHALGNWFTYLQFVFEGQPAPAAASASFRAHCQKAGLQPKGGLDFPDPDAWVLPPLD